ncbi:MAG: molybdopterin-dependent oxidoreductase [Rhodospirillales bacterium]|jgi:formate dehydrogenase (coenzyme F420) alpha subunit|nr:molybdopterin-dependent oxidoreductase [Rhodospirillales bacterium]
MTEMSRNFSPVNTFCRMCDNHCAITVHRDVSGQISDIESYPDHPWNQGRICSKAGGAVEIVNHPDRLMRPLKKVGSGWKEIDLEQALDEIADRVGDLQSNYGPETMSVWKGEATSFNQQEDLAKRFCRALGTPNYLSVDSLCFCTREIGWSLVYGCWPKPDFRNSRCMILWGANPPAAHPPLTRQILKGRERGATLVVIDPRLSTIARQADIHVKPKPGTDGALAWGLAHQLIANDWYDKDFVKNYTVGFDKVAVYAKDFTPEAVEAQTGVPAQTVIKVAALMHQAGSRVAQYTGNGVEHYENGVNNTRAIAYLDALCGSFDMEGGSLQADGLGQQSLALYEEIPLQQLKRVDGEKFPVLHDFRQECNTMTALDAILTGDPYSLRGMIMTAANPVMTNPNSEKVRKALSALDLFVVRELFMTETAQLADYILPAATFLERTELYTYAAIQSVSMSTRVQSIPGVQDEYQFWHDIAHRMDFGEHFPWEDESVLNEWLLQSTDVDFKDLQNTSKAVQYQAIKHKKWQHRPLTTPSGKVEFASSYLVANGYEEVGEYKAPYYIRSPKPEYPFSLITGARNHLSYHSSYRGVGRFRAEVPGPQVEMHPDDADGSGITDGETVKLSSAIGSIEIPVKIVSRQEIIPGVLQATHGWKEANINVLTHDDILDPIDGFPVQKGVAVKVERIR